MVKINREVAGEATLNDQQKVWWNEIRIRDIEIFGLEDQHVSNFANPINLDPNSLYLIIKAPAAVPAIETALAGIKEFDKETRLNIPKYNIKMVDKYMSVSPNEGRIVIGVGGKPTFIPVNK